ncbi:hypothetical protein [Parasitella parasitica]|uniref:CCHC-type domain-containing protein n=1 Tax=Parasitella parasitica TaxID=35722 RepID=A0A0B7NMF1_9FUNG|nr:hypothetical protein [Parasitella parasitica]
MFEPMSTFSPTSATERSFEVPGSLASERSLIKVLDPCPLDHTYFVPLQRVVPWKEDDGDLWKILLSWDAIPDYCHCCGTSDHCRTDCPDRLNWLKCFNCNRTGHEWKHCPCNNDATDIEAPSKTRAVPVEHKKSGRKTPLKMNNFTVAPMIPTPDDSNHTGGTNTGEGDDDVLMTGTEQPPVNASKNRLRLPVSETVIIQELNVQPQATLSHWTSHCGIVILNNIYSLDVMRDGIDGGRFILARIKLGASFLDDAFSCATVVTVLNIYGRSS